MDLKILRDNRGVTLVTMVMVIIVITIIASVSIIGGTEIMKNAKESKEKENLTAVKSIVNDIYIKQNTAGFFTPGGANYYGTPAYGLVSGDEESLNGWYFLGKDDLEEMGIEYLEENYLVNYKKNKVVAYKNWKSDVKADDDEPEIIEKPNSATTLAKSGTLKVGDYVAYKPKAQASYTTNPDNTGTTAQTFSVDETASWRILSIDSATGKVLITTYGPVNSGLTLYGVKGFLNVKTSLDEICENLYSNTDLGTTARSMTIEDANEAFNYVDSGPARRYAYYPRGTTLSDAGAQVEFNGNLYTKVVYTARKAQFYKCDGGGVEKVSNGNTYREPTATEPVYISHNDYSYEPRKLSTASEVLGTSYGWLASQCIELQAYNASYKIRYISQSSTGQDTLCYSASSESSSSKGIRPVVVLDSSCLINLADTTKNGSSAAKAWELTK